MDVLWGAAASAATGIIVGLATWRVSVDAMRRDELRRMRRDSLTSLAANRYDLQGPEFSRALNSACVVWAESSVVLDALKRFQAAVMSGEADEAQGAILNLLRGMAAELGLELGDLSDEFLLTPFNTVPASRLPRPRGE